MTEDLQKLRERAWRTYFGWPLRKAIVQYLGEVGEATQAQITDAVNAKGYKTAKKKNPVQWSAVHNHLKLWESAGAVLREELPPIYPNKQRHGKKPVTTTYVLYRLSPEFKIWLLNKVRTALSVQVGMNG